MTKPLAFATTFASGEAARACRAGDVVSAFGPSTMAMADARRNGPCRRGQPTELDQVRGVRQQAEHVGAAAGTHGGTGRERHHGFGAPKPGGGAFVGETEH